MDYKEVCRYTRMLHRFGALKSLKLRLWLGFDVLIGSTAVDKVKLREFLHRCVALANVNIVHFRRFGYGRLLGDKGLHPLLKNGFDEHFPAILLTRGSG